MWFFILNFTTYFSIKVKEILQLISKYAQHCIDSSSHLEVQLCPMSVFKIHGHAVEKVAIKVHLKDIPNINFVMETPIL